MEQIESVFEIKAEKKEGALEAIKELVSSGPGLPPKDLRWVCGKILEKAKTLKKAMEECRWVIEEDEDGNVDGIYFEGEKYGDEDIIFEAMAPFVEKRSYIQMSGEEGATWRWVFDGKKCKEIWATITWED